MPGSNTRRRRTSAATRQHSAMDSQEESRPNTSQDSSDAQYHCLKCKLVVEDEDASVACEGCDGWSHLPCAKLESAEVDRIKNYFCDTCESTGLRTMWYCRVIRPTNVKRQHYYEVERIRKYSVRNSKRFFLIEWKDSQVRGSKRNAQTWEPEEHLDGCLDMLQSYLRRNKLQLSKIEGLLGSTSSASAMKTNWHTMDTILERFRKNRIRLQLDHMHIEIGEFSHLKQHDGLYFLAHEFHCFVILYINAEKKAYLGDGGNTHRMDVNVRNEIASYLPDTRIVSCEFTRLTRVDHCASSALFIGIEFLRAYQAGTKPLRVNVSDYLYERETKSMHKEVSKVTQKLPLHLRRHQLMCFTCGRKFKTHARKMLSNHIRACRK